jgi:hypothetical protein
METKSTMDAVANANQGIKLSLPQKSRYPLNDVDTCSFSCRKRYSRSDLPMPAAPTTAVESAASAEATTAAMEPTLTTNRATGEAC